MPYQLVLSESGEEGDRDVGENIFLDNLPSDYSIYLFYYPSPVGNPELEQILRNLGDMTGTNLFVNMGKLNDPKYRSIANQFDIKTLPVIIVSGLEDLASDSTGSYTAFVKIDSGRMLNAPDQLLESLNKIFNLFITGQISEAIKQERRDERNLLLRRLGNVVASAMTGVGKYIADTDISVSVMQGKFELKRSGR